MKRMAWWLIGLALIFGRAAAQDTQTEKETLKYKFEKGDKLTMKLKQKMAVKLDEIPEEYKEMIGDEPFAIDFNGDISLEVKETKDDGSASIEGKFKTMRIKGNALMNDIDFDYDAAKGLQKKDDDGDDSQNPLGMDPTKAFRDLATQTLNLKVDALGKLSFEGGQQGTEILSQILSLNGLMGSLPKDKVGVGDKWKSKDQLGIPGMAQFKINLRADNTFEKKETVNDQECAVIKTKFSVGTTTDEGGKKDDGEEQGNMFNMKTKMTGEGEGLTHFAIKAGRVAKTTNKVKIKITANMDNPQGGDALQFKATLNIEQQHEITK